MQAMIGKKKKMSEMYDGLVMYPQVLENIKVIDKKTALDDEDVREKMKEVAEELECNGCILVRESEIKSVIQVMVEAETIMICQEMVNRVVKVMKNKGL